MSAEIVVGEIAIGLMGASGSATSWAAADGAAETGAATGSAIGALAGVIELTCSI
jgi:hypothetical protein